MSKYFLGIQFYSDNHNQINTQQQQKKLFANMSDKLGFKNYQ